MEDDRYSRLVNRMEQVANAVNAFESPEVQMLAFKALIATLDVGIMEDQEEAPSRVEGETRRAPKPQAKRKANKKASTESSSASNLDHNTIINEIKEDSRFDKFNRKIILGDVSRGIRAKFVSWYTHDRAISSGDVSRVLQGLGVKFDPSTASRAMSDVSSDYLKTQEGRFAMYRLTSRAYADFESWLLNDAEV